MSLLLLDTNVISELRKIRAGKAAPKLAHWAATLDTTTLFISTITIHELEIGIRLIENRDPHQGAVFRAWLETQILPSFADRILPIDTAIARRAAALHVPNPKPINDAFIAATALIHGFTLVTRNTADFIATGVSLLNPWH